MRNYYLCDNATVANGAVFHSKFFAQFKSSCFVSLSLSASSSLNERGVKFSEIGVKLKARGASGYTPDFHWLRAFFPIKFAADLLRFRRAKRRCINLLSKHGCRNLYVSSDRSYANGHLMPFIAAARQLGIKIYIPEYADFADGERLLQARISANRVINAGWATRVFCPNWVAKAHDGRAIAYYPTSTLLTWKLFGCLSKYPNCVGGLHGVCVQVRNEATMKRLELLGVGDIECVDNFYLEGMQKGSASFKYAFAVALPQLAEHNLVDAATAAELLSNLIKALDDLYVDYLVFLHPKMDRARYTKLLTGSRCTIYDGNSHRGLYETRCFINTYSSLTHEAVALGLSVHVYDPLKFRYSMFREYQEVSYSESLEDLSSFLAKQLKEATE